MSAKEMSREWNGSVKKNTRTSEYPQHLMEVHISSFLRGVEVYKDVQIIRVRKSSGNLLILEDHMPIMGELVGSLTFVSGKDEYTLENIQGFFAHCHNLFEMIIREGSYVE